MDKSYLIKDTTKEERIALIKSWVPDDEVMDAEGAGFVGFVCGLYQRHQRNCRVQCGV